MPDTPSHLIQRHSRSLFASLIGLALLTSACSALPTSTGAENSTPKSKQATPTSVTTQTVIELREPNSFCEGLTAAEVGRLGADDAIETSGIAVSSNLAGPDPSTEAQTLLWLHNDSGTSPGVFATTSNGTNLRRFTLEAGTEGVAASDLEGSDVEDIALFDGTIYLADIGDNNAERTSIRIFSFPEPSLEAESSTIESATVTTLTYPDGAHDAEAFAVDPIAGAILILTKSIGLRFGDNPGLGAATATLYSAPLAALSGDGPVQLAVEGTVDAAALEARATQTPADGRPLQFGIGGLVTAMDITADGQLIGLRTYGSVWLFQRLPTETVAEALARPGCEAPVVAEPMGEAVAFTPLSAEQLNTGENPGFFTISEGVKPPIHQTR